MFDRRKNHKKRTNPVFIIFRLFLSLIIFATLIGGVYSAYKEFSGADPLEISPKAIITNFSSTEKITAFLLSIVTKDLKQKVDDVKDSVSGEKTKGSVSQQGANSSQLKPEKIAPKDKSAISFKFALVADSHSENENLAKALSKAKENKAQFFIGLGDYTEVGTEQELESAKHKFDENGIRYFITAGDHDLWDSRNKSVPPLTNFNKIFGPSNQAFSFGNAKILILDNSDNYLGLGQLQIDWLNGQLSTVKNQPEINVIFVGLHEPLYHPSSSRVMGKVTEQLKSEAKKLIKMLKDAGVKEVFSGDIHFFTRYIEPETGLSMTTIGALTSLRNTQESRFGLVTVYEDGTYEVEDVEIK